MTVAPSVGVARLTQRSWEELPEDLKAIDLDGRRLILCTEPNGKARIVPVEIVTADELPKSTQPPLPSPAINNKRHARETAQTATL